MSNVQTGATNEPIDVRVLGNGDKQQIVALDIGDGTTAATLVAPTTVPPNNARGIPVRQIGQDIWNVSFSEVGASVISPQFGTPIVGTGVGYSQAAGALAITAGTTTNAEFLTRSTQSWQGALRLRFSTVLSQRNANNNFAVLLADLVREGAAITVNSATSISVNIPSHGFTAQNVGQFMLIGGIAGIAGAVPGRYAIASIPNADTVNFTVAGWPASGSGTATIFGHSYVRHLFTGATATNVNVNVQRRGWSDTDTTATINTTASPGTIIQFENDGRTAVWSDFLRATATTPDVTTRATRFENMPDDNLDLFLFIWSYNGTVAPTATTWTISFMAVEKYANNPVYVQGFRAAGTVHPVPVKFPTAQSVSISGTPGVNATLQAATVRAGFVAAAGIWYDDSATTLAAGATFTGTSRDATVTATATAHANAATYASEVRVVSESDVGGDLWVEYSRDNTAWRRVKSVAATAVTGGGFAAEIIFRPAWRYWRCGYTNGAGAQARFTIGSMAQAA